MAERVVWMVTFTYDTTVPLAGADAAPAGEHKCFIVSSNPVDALKFMLQNSKGRIVHSIQLIPGETFISDV